jgi:hypothetical protein
LRVAAIMLSCLMVLVQALLVCSRLAALWPSSHYMPFSLRALRVIVATMCLWIAGSSGGCGSGAYAVGIALCAWSSALAGVEAATFGPCGFGDSYCGHYFGAGPGPPGADTTSHAESQWDLLGSILDTCGFASDVNVVLSDAKAVSALGLARVAQVQNPLTSAWLIGQVSDASGAFPSACFAGDVGAIDLGTTFGYDFLGQAADGAFAYFRVCSAGVLGIGDGGASVRDRVSFRGWGPGARVILLSAILQSPSA